MAPTAWHRTTVSSSPTGDVVTVPWLRVEGEDPGPSAVVLGGVHGDEMTGPFVIGELIDWLGTVSLRGQVTLVPVANPQAVAACSRYGPDRRDLNRSFPGRANGSPTARLAHALMAVMSGADVVIDVHAASSALRNATHIRVTDVAGPVGALASASGVTAVLVGAPPKGSLRAALATDGVESLTVESGGAPWAEPRCVRETTSAIRRVLSALGCVEEVQVGGASPTTCTGGRWVRAATGGLFSPMVEHGAPVQAGDVLGRIWLPGATTEAVTSPVQGVLVNLRRHTAVLPGDALAHVLTA